MNRLSVTIIDILGVLVPGAVFLGGCLLLPSSLAPISAMLDLIYNPIKPPINPWISAGAWLVTSYVIGFLIRLVSIPLMNRLTIKYWANKLKAESAALEKALDMAVDNDLLSTSLKEVSKLHGWRDPGHYAPYFHFSKRLIRRHPEMWNEAERLEAEVRFAAGLFIPFVLLVVAGGLLAIMEGNYKAWAPIAIGLAGAGLVVRAFPSRRSKEVLYDQYLALAILLYSDPGDLDGSSKTGKGE